MNRVLRRPMFRTGGSAEGITSGLDNPQLTASRPAYNRGRVVNPGGYKGEEEEYARVNKILQDIRGPQESRFPEFLTGWGLDLLTRPKSGNIFQQAAASAKGPYSEWMAARAASGAGEDKLSAALLGDVMDVQARKELQTEELESKERIAKMEFQDKDKQFEYKGQLTDYEALIDEGTTLANKLEELENVPIGPTGEGKNEAAIKNVKEKLEKNAKLQAFMSGDEDDEIRKTLLKQIGEDLADWADLVYYDKMGVLPPHLLERTNQATGGRVGYQNAGAVMPNTIPRAIPAAMQAPRTMDQGQDDTVQDLSFEELRARLPQEITNDIVKLLSESKQALVDFANIRTQQDVNEFNQKYDVNLVVPQEV